MIITTVESDDNEMVITYNNNNNYDNKCKANKIMLTIILMNKQ